MASILSFRVANALPQRFRQLWNLSMSGLRYAAERLSIRSDARSHADHNVAKSRDEDETMPERYNRRDKEFGHFEQQGSAATISNIPLVHVDSKSSKSSHDIGLAVSRAGDYTSKSAENENENTIRGYGAVQG
ncbi:MAG: hypothetical protein Q9191_003077 [Dirinaria sp. TL-2023a]